LLRYVLFAATAELEYRLLAQEIAGPPGSVETQGPSPGSERHRLLHFSTYDDTESAEILDGAKMDVGGLPPVVGKIVGARHLPAEHHLQADAPVAEIRKRDNAAPPDAQHVLEHNTRAPSRLQRLRQDDVVEP